MEKPDVDLTTLSFGKIFQIDPNGKHSFQVQFGGDFLISTRYEEGYVTGYLANVHETQNLVRWDGLSYIKIPWEFLECVGNVNWFKKINEESEDAKV